MEPAVAEVVRRYFEEEYGNEGSRTHNFGARARQGVQKAREQIASLVDAKPEEIVFTSGATESNNLAILGLAIAIGSLTKSLPLTPGGIGPYEATLTLIFLIGKVPKGIAGAASIIDNALKNVVTLVFGFGYLYYFNLKFSDIVERK